MSHSPGSSLTETLILALSQCQEQLKVIQQHSDRIDRLQQENERLTRELQKYQDAAARNAQGDADQTQELFQNYAEAQAEIQVLKSKIRSYKAKASQRLRLPISSPLSTPVTPVPSSPRQSSTKRKSLEALSSPVGLHGEKNQDGEQEAHSRSSGAASSSPSRKRARLDDSEPASTLQEIAPNVVQMKPAFTSVSRNDLVDRKIAAISHLAEDGEENAPGSTGEDMNALVVDQNNPIYHRLDGLLAGSIPNKNRLAKPVSRSPRSAASLFKPQMRPLPGISNIQHAVSTTSGLSGVQMDSNKTITQSENVESAGQSGSGQMLSRQNGPSPMSKRLANVSKHTEPLRARPVTAMRLSSFKPNPRWLSSHNISFDDFLNDRQYERMRTLAATLPHLPGETHDHHFTDHELLMDFLGPGSESKVASLTPVARQNLITEARTKRVADEFRLSKQTAAFDDHADDPPGFWSTDMPGTQEAEENKAASRQKEREEVKRRYDDAISGQGRWIFADE